MLTQTSLPEFPVTGDKGGLLPPHGGVPVSQKRSISCFQGDKRGESEYPSCIDPIFSSVAQLCRLFVTPWTQHIRLPHPSPTPRACSNSCPLSGWCYPTISSPIVPFSCLQSFPVPGSFSMSQFFPSGGQSIGVSASAPDLPMNTQDWLPLGWTGWISLQSKGLSRVFSNTTVFFGAQLSLQYNFHIHTWLLE